MLDLDVVNFTAGRDDVEQKHIPVVSDPNLKSVGGSKILKAATLEIILDCEFGASLRAWDFQWKWTAVCSSNPTRTMDILSMSHSDKTNWDRSPCP